MILLAALVLHALAAGSQTLQHIRESNNLRCGINTETPEYSTSDDHGPRVTFDTDLCRAVAVAILGGNARVTTSYYPDDVTAGEALRGGQIDLIPSQTIDLTHASGSDFLFSPPVLYDAVGMLVPLAGHVTQAAQLDGKKVCFLAETQVEVALRAWFSRQRLHFVPYPFQEEGEMEAAFVTGNCAALVGDLTRLAATRLAFGPLADRYALLPDQLAQDPLAAASRAEDPGFASIARWTLEVLLNAEALGLRHQAGTAIATAAESSSDPAIRIFTGQTREIGARLSLANDWAVQVIAAVGNYGEIYARDLGEQSATKLPRALNHLYTQGGLMYPLPLK